MSETEDQKPANDMHVTKALSLIESYLSSQRNYSAASVLKSAAEYILLLEGRVKAIDANDNKANAA